MSLKLAQHRQQNYRHCVATYKFLPLVLKRDAVDGNKVPLDMLEVIRHDKNVGDNSTSYNPPSLANTSLSFSGVASVSHIIPSKIHPFRGQAQIKD